MKKKRIESFDFVRGMLLVFMTLAHVEFRYAEVCPGEELYYVLRFAQRGFVLLAAYSLTYLSFRAWSENPAPVRNKLVIRSLKLLAVFVVLNGITLLFLTVIRPDTDFVAFYAKGSAKGEEYAAEWGLFRILYEVFIVKSGILSYDILVPIAYMLLVAPFVFKLISRNAGLVFTIVAVIVSLILLNTLRYEEDGRMILKPYYNLNLLLYAVAGLVAGLLAMRHREALHRFRQGPIGLLVFAVLTAAVYFVLFSSGPDEFKKTALYQLFHLLWLSVVLMFLYQLHWIGKRSALVMKPLLLFSRYSLVVYILQVFFLTFLSRVPYPFKGWTLFIFVTAVNLLIVWACVIVLDFGRRRFPLVDRTFRAVFP